MVENAYPLLPVVDYEHTTVAQDEVIQVIKNWDAHPDIKSVALVIFNNESGNGMHGVNNNYTGLQADGAKLGGDWDSQVIATCVVKENSTGHERRFCVFADFKTSIGFLLVKVAKRGLYIGGIAKPYSKLRIFSEKDLARAYYKEWVLGDANAEPTDNQVIDFINQYAKAKNCFYE